MMTSLSNLLRDDRGASVIELALVAPILATMIIGMVDMSSGFSQKLILEQAAQRSIEKAMQVEKGETWTEDADFYDSLQTEAATAAGVDTSAVTVKYWLECEGVSQFTSFATMEADYEKVCTGTQDYARFVTVSIQKKFTPMFKQYWPGTNADGTYTMTGKAGIRVQ